MNEPGFLHLIPHRMPFLFIDRVVELSEDRIITTWRVDPEAGFFAGHYPGDPVMPGVLICECAFQAGALLVAHRLDEAARSSGTPVLTRIKEIEPTVPVVIMTGYASMETAIEAVNKGAYSYLRKQTSNDEIKQTVKSGGK